MKILYIANSRLPTEKAHGLQIMKTIEALINQGVEVTLLLPRRRNSIVTDIQAYYGLNHMPRLVYVPNIFGFLESHFHKLYFSLQRLFFFKATFWYGLFSNCDAIYSREITACFFLSLFGKRAYFEDHEPKKRWRGLYNLFIRRIYRKIIVAQGLVELYESVGVARNSYTVIPNGVDVDEFKSASIDKNIWRDFVGLEPNEKVILYVGHFYKWKGVFTLLDASEYIEIGQIVMIGGLPNDREMINDYIKQHELGRIHVHPFVTHEKIIPILKSADVLILPNTREEERSSKYTTPIKLFEYMAAGVPIVASDVESFRWYLKDNENALIFKADDPKSLGQMINQVLSDADLAQKLVDNAKKTVLDYTWEHRAELIISYITNKNG